MSVTDVAMRYGCRASRCIAGWRGVGLTVWAGWWTARNGRRRPRISCRARSSLVSWSCVAPTRAGAGSAGDELGRVGVQPVPSRMSVCRALVRSGPVTPGKRCERREESAAGNVSRWRLWQLDVVEGVSLRYPVSGALRFVKAVTGVDDHSRYCVIASVVERATGRRRAWRSPRR